MYDAAYVAAHTTGFEQLRTFLQKYTPAYVASLTGLTAETIARVASLYGRAQSAFIGLRYRSSTHAFRARLRASYVARRSALEMG
jgi:anaerobic selenocysteine-containing dehydrogenase